MNWRITVTWTILLLSENFGSTYSCQCPCNSTASNYSTNGTTTISTSDITNTTVNSKGTSGPSTTTAYISSDTTTITSTTIHISTKSQSKTTSATNIQTTTCTNTSTNVVCDSLNYTVHKTCGRSYEVINVTGHVGGNVILKKCNDTRWHNVDWIHYGHYTHKMCELGDYHRTTLQSGICFECNDTSLTIYNLTTANAGKYTRRRRDNSDEENYYVTVLTRDTTTSTSGTCPVKYNAEPKNTESTIGSNIIETIQKANIPLGLHAIWAGIVVSVALIALYMGSHRTPKKPRYTKLPKYDPDEFWTKT